MDFVLGFIRATRPRAEHRDITKGEGKGLMISLGDSYVRLELMHLLSVVVGGVSFCEHTRPKKKLYIYYIENIPLIYFRRRVMIFAAQ